MIRTLIKAWFACMMVACFALSVAILVSAYQAGQYEFWTTFSVMVFIGSGLGLLAWETE